MTRSRYLKWLQNGQKCFLVALRASFMTFSCPGVEDPVEQLYQCLMLSSVAHSGKFGH